MTVETEQSSKTYTGNSATETFPTTFKFLHNSHITVTLIEDDVETVLTEDVDYTLTGAGDEEGGDVTINPAPTEDQTIYIERNTPILQDVDLRPAGPYLADTIEEMFDKLTLIAQENRRRIEAREAVETPEASSLDVVYADKTFLTGDNVEDSFPMNVAVTGGSTATGAWAVRLRNLDDPSERFDEPPAIQADPGVGDNVSVKYCSGLKPNTNYTLRIAAVIP